MVTRWPGPRRCGRPGGPLGEAPVVDADHVLGPLARREIAALLEAHEPIVRVFGSHDQERSLLFEYGESPFYLWFDAIHPYQTSTFTLPLSTTTS
jgi:hypothetical protein